MVDLPRSYVAYGLGIRSDLELAELVVAERRADVEVRTAAIGEPRGPVRASGQCFRVAGDGVYLSWDDVGCFRVRGGSEIAVDRAAGVDEGVLRLFVLGPALAVLLDQRGRHVLHASAVAVEGRAVAFLGASGWGKSTLAAALHVRGHALLADDLVPVEFDSQRPVTTPGFPHLKLFPNVAAELGGRELVGATEGRDKGLVCASVDLPPTPLPLERIYVLAGGEKEGVEDVAPNRAAIDLVRHSWCALLHDPATAGALLAGSARLAETVPVRRLRYPRSLERLPALTTLVEGDLER